MLRTFELCSQHIVFAFNNCPIFVERMTYVRCWQKAFELEGATWYVTDNVS